jgi:hypothetical protein
MALTRILSRSGSLLLLVLGGCGSEPASPDLGSLHGQVISLEERAPVQGARLVLIDASRNAPSSDVVVSDSQGRYRIDSIPPGWHYLVVQAGPNVVYDPINSAFRVAARERLTREVVVAPYPFFTAGPRVRGRVVDATSGEPLSGASVSVGSMNLAALFSGLGSPWEAVSDSAGKFHLGNVPVAYATSGAPLGIVPVVASRSGFLPGGTGSFLRREWIPLPAAGETAEVVIALRRGSGSGRVLGRITSSDRGVGGVSVALALIDTTASGDVGAARRRLETRSMIPDLLAVSDAGGDFEIARVPAGRYAVQAGYLPDDGWIGQNPIAAGITVHESGVVHVELTVIRAVHLVQPVSGDVVSTGQPLLVWRRLPGADSYRVSFSLANSFVLGQSLATTDTSVVVPAGFWGDGDYARWSVDAYQGSRLVGSSESIDAFHIESR